MIRIVLFGYGSLGKEIFQTLNENSQFKIAAVIDNDESKIGKILSTNSSDKIKILSSIDKLKSKADILIHVATSSIDEAYLQFCSIAKKKIPIISTCEQLVYPTKNNKKTVKKINFLAKRYGISILGVGVNPGFLMDSLVVMLSSVCTKITKIRVKRFVDVAKRRKALQKKMGVGLSRTEFNKNKVGHVGLAESASMICDALNTKCSFFEKINPVIARKSLALNGLVVKKGRVCGTRHILVAKNKNHKFLEMELAMSVGQDEYDLIDIKGDPPVHIKTSGIMGDKATISLLLNYIPTLLKSKPRFYTINEMPLPINFS